MAPRPDVSPAGAAGIMRDMLRVSHPVTGARPAVFRGSDGQLWLDPARVLWEPREAFQLFEHNGQLYELWGRRSDRCWWIGTVSPSVPEAPAAA
jgi:hypothetical protein